MTTRRRRRRQPYGREFAAVYDVRWGFWSHRMWPYLHRLVQRRRPVARTWLDLCCGTGALLELVAAHGYEVTGIDRSPAQLRHARRRAPTARLHRCDVRELNLGARYDVITCLFDSLNYLTTLHDLERALRRARRHLAPGGLFVFDVNTFEGLLQEWNKTDTLRDRDHTVILESTFDPRRAIGRCRITGFVRDEGASGEGGRYRMFDEEHVERGYLAEEIEGALHRAGLAYSTRDGYSLGRPRRGSLRLVYVCRHA